MNIKEKLKETLNICIVQNNWPTFGDYLKPLNQVFETILKDKEKAIWLDTSDLYFIFNEHIYHSIIVNNKTQDDYSGNLKELLSDKEINDLSKNFVEFIESIPRDYEVYLPIAKPSNNSINDISISDSVELISISDKESLTVQTSKNMLETNELSTYKYYLKLHLKGYFNFSIDNKNVKRALSKFKILIQIGVYKSIFKLKNKNINSLSIGEYLSNHHQIPKHEIISIEVKDNQNYITTMLPIDFSKYLGNLDINWGYINERPQLLIPQTKDEFILQNLKQAFQLIASTSTEANNIKSAIEWYFESTVDSNKTFSFIKLCIGFESLFDDIDKNITERLADRYSFLVSQSIKERPEIKKKFKEFYQIRSKLVHGNKSTLNENEKLFLEWGQHILMKSINKELYYLKLEFK